MVLERGLFLESIDGVRRGSEWLEVSYYMYETRVRTSDFSRVRVREVFVGMPSHGMEWNNMV